jgi:hypothetical protein
VKVRSSKPELSLFGKTTMQLPTLSSVTPHLIPVSALIVALCGVYITVKTLTEKRNADLVRIGISVLRVDPDKEKQISEATREWALNLIDANAGGVTFSPEARAQLLKGPLKSSASDKLDYSSNDAGATDHWVPVPQK